MSIESVMPSNHLVLCCPLLLLPSIFPRIRVFSKESLAVHSGKNEAIGLMQDVVRMHIGLESVDTLIADIKQALDLAFGA